MISLLVAVTVVGSAIGDLLCSAGMKRQGEFTDWSARGVLRLLGNPFVLAGIPANVIAFFALIALLSVTALSFAIPVTAIGYVLETALAKWVLKEEVPWQRWAGAGFVTIGIFMLFF